MVDIEKSQFLEESFKFWYNDHDHIRSPFPEYIREELKEKATKKFSDWLDNLKQGAEKEVDDAVIAEKFEELIFECGLELVKNEDEKITILYPFLPRLGDEITDKNQPDKGRSVITSRTIEKEGDTAYLKVDLENIFNKEQWETRFELPA